MNQLLDNIPGIEPIDLRDQAIFELLYGTGIRVGECSAIDISDINLNDGQLLIHSKGNKDRIIPLGEHIIECLKNYLKVRSSFHHNLRSEYALFLSIKGNRASTG